MNKKELLDRLKDLQIQLYLPTSLQLNQIRTNIFEKIWSKQNPIIKYENLQELFMHTLIQSAIKVRP